MVFILDFISQGLVLDMNAVNWIMNAELLILVNYECSQKINEWAVSGYERQLGLQIYISQPVD